MMSSSTTILTLEFHDVLQMWKTIGQVRQAKRARTVMFLKECSCEPSGVPQVFGRVKTFKRMQEFENLGVKPLDKVKFGLYWKDDYELMAKVSWTMVFCGQKTAKSGQIKKKSNILSQIALQKIVQS